MQDVLGEPVERLWSDERIAFRAHNTPTERKAQYVISLLRQVRDDYEQQIAKVKFESEERNKTIDAMAEDIEEQLADRARLVAQVEALGAELAQYRGDDWGKTVDYLISLAPEPEPPLPEPPDDWNEEAADNE